MEKRIGIIKFFGGYNNKTQSYNDFGFMQDGVFIPKYALLCKSSELHEGTFVTYEYDSNLPIPFGKSINALKVQLLSEENDLNYLLTELNNKNSNISMMVKKRIFEYIRSNENVIQADQVEKILDIIGLSISASHNDIIYFLNNTNNLEYLSNSFVIEQLDNLISKNKDVYCLKSLLLSTTLEIVPLLVEIL